MRFILAPGSIAKLDSLRAEYTKIRKVDLDKDPSMIGLPTMFGGTNVKARSVQVTFLEKIKIILQANLLKEEDIKTPEQWQANLTASRVMIAACLYVQDQISRPKNDSALYRVIHNSLGINGENYFDDEDKEVCYLAANRLISSSKIALEDANSALKKAGKKPITEKEWSEFSKFLIGKCNETKVENPYTNYPITSITQPLFGAAFSYTGATIGFLGGNIVSQSSYLMPTRYKLTALIGTTLVVIGSAGPAGIALFVPVVADQLVTTFCRISLAHVLGVTLGLLGQGVGLGVGLPLDLAYRLLWNSASAISSYYSKGNNSPELSGVRIADGMVIVHGIPLQITPEDQLPEGYKKHAIEIKSDGTWYIDGKLNEVPEMSPQLPSEVIDELKEELKSRREDQIDEATPLTASM